MTAVDDLHGIQLARRLDMRALLTGSVRRVSHTTRFSGTPTLRPESVAEHHYVTAQYAMLIGLEMIQLGGAVNMGKLLTRALVHDLDEALMPDLPRPVKYSDPELTTVWHKLAHNAVVKLEAELGVLISDYWYEAKERSLEGDILAVADMLSVIGYVIEEIRLGNSYMKEVLENSTKYIRDLLESRPMSNELKSIIWDGLAVARLEWRSYQ